MSGWNRNNRIQNMVRTSVAGSICQVVNLVMAFVYRTVFIRLLSVNYLGVSGMFTNLLELLSLAELGITAAISFKLYSPISKGDTRSVGELMALYQWIYRGIALLVLAIGMALYPLIDRLVMNAAEVPADLDLHLIYLLYLARSVASYLCVYKLTLLSADQRDDIRSITDAVTRTLIYVLQIVSLLIWRSFVLSLIIAIAVTLIQNILFSAWVSRRYRDVFAVRTLPPKEERKAVYRAMTAGGYHRLGAVILSSTDQLVLTKFAGLVASGLYANYAIITTALKLLILQLMGSGTASLGNARVEMDDAQNVQLYQKLLTLNLAVTGFVTFCLFALMNDFIGIWLGPSLQLSSLTAAVLCIQFFMDTGRFATDAYINGCGLFVRDRFRPLIEALLNLVISVFLVLKIGIPGVFIGTFVSFGLTAFWRAPLLLCRDGLHCSTVIFWRRYLAGAGMTLAACKALWLLKLPPAASWLQWLCKAVACAAVYLVAGWILFRRDHCVRALCKDAAAFMRKRLGVKP